MIVIFLIIILLLNNIYANNQAIGYFIKNDYLGGKVVGLVFTYVFFIAILFISYKTNQNILLNSMVFIIGSIINYFLYNQLYKIHLKKHNKDFLNDKCKFLINHKNDLLEDIEKNLKKFELTQEDFKNLKELKVMKGAVIGDSLLLPYEFLKKEKSQKKYSKYGLNQSLIDGFGITSDDSDHLMMTYKSLKNTENVIDFKTHLSKNLKTWLFTLPIGIGMTTIKSILKLLMGFSPDKSGIDSLGNGPLMRVAIISTYFYDDEIKRNEYIKASTQITNNNLEAIKITQLIGNVIAYIIKNNKKPTEEEYQNLLKCSNDLTKQYINIFLNNLNTDLNSFLKLISSSDKVTGYIMPSSIFILYVLHNSQNYKEAFEMIIKTSGDTDTIGAVIGSIFSILDEDILKDKKLNNILLTQNKNILNYTYLNTLIKNLVSIPIIFIHGIIRFF